MTKGELSDFVLLRGAEESEIDVGFNVEDGVEIDGAAFVLVRSGGGKSKLELASTIAGEDEIGVKIEVTVFLRSSLGVKSSSKIISDDDDDGDDG